jgi:hypothetical protein
MSRTDEFARREQRAAELLGTYAVKTAGGLMIASQRRVIDGWLYANSTHLLFLADTIMGGSGPGMLDARTLLAHPSRGCRRGLNPPVSSRLLAM